MDATLLWTVRNGMHARAPTVPDGESKSLRRQVGGDRLWWLRVDTMDARTLRGHRPPYRPQVEAAPSRQSTAVAPSKLDHSK